MATSADEMAKFINKVLRGTDPVGSYPDEQERNHKRAVIRGLVCVGRTHDPTQGVGWSHLKFPREWHGEGEFGGVHYELVATNTRPYGRTSSAHRLFFRCLCGQRVPLGRAMQHAFGSAHYRTRTSSRATSCVAAEEALLSLAVAMRNNELASDTPPPPDMEAIDPEALEAMRAASKGRDGVRWSVWRNADLSSRDLGRLQFIMYGPGCTYTSLPERCPDTPSCGFGWRYGYIGDVDLQAGRVVQNPRA